MGSIWNAAGNIDVMSNAQEIVHTCTPSQQVQPRAPVSKSMLLIDNSKFPVCDRYPVHKIFNFATIFRERFLTSKKGTVAEEAARRGCRRP